MLYQELQKAMLELQFNLDERSLSAKIFKRFDDLFKQFGVEGPNFINTFHGFKKRTKEAANNNNSDLVPYGELAATGAADMYPPPIHQQHRRHVNLSRLIFCRPPFCLQPFSNTISNC
jgi:hypothetical protein